MVFVLPFSARKQPLTIRNFQSFKEWNIVGYDAEALRSGFKAQGACFVPVSGAKIDLTDIVVKGHEGECADEVYIQSLDQDGKTVAGSKYYWYNAYDEDGNLWYGWFDGSSEPVAKGQVKYDVCDGLWISATGADLGFQTSGQVDQIGSAMILRAGFKLTANPTPVKVDLTTIKIAGHEGECADEVYIQSLDKDGKTVAGSKYYWYNAYDEDGNLWYGWFDGSSEPVNEKTVFFEPGEAIWVSATGTDLQIEYPGVEL